MENNPKVSCSNQLFAKLNRLKIEEHALSAAIIMPTFWNEEFEKIIFDCADSKTSLRNIKKQLISKPSIKRIDIERLKIEMFALDKKLSRFRETLANELQNLKKAEDSLKQYIEPE